MSDLFASEDDFPLLELLSIKLHFDVGKGWFKESVE